MSNLKLPKEYQDCTIKDCIQPLYIAIGSTNHLSIIGPRGGGGVDSGQAVAGTGGAYDPIGIQHLTAINSLKKKKILIPLTQLL